MSKGQNKPAEENQADADADQSMLRKRLDMLVTRFAAQNLQAQLDFDRFVNDGLSDERGNLLSQMGTFSLRDRGPGEIP